MALWLLLLPGCSDEAEYAYPDCDLVNPSVCFFVTDAATGANLLDPAAAGTVLGKPIAVTYRGKWYAVTADAAASMTRAFPARPLALRLEKSDPLGNIEGVRRIRPCG